jgi:hypothetical protein
MTGRFRRVNGRIVAARCGSPLRHRQADLLRYTRADAFAAGGPSVREVHAAHRSDLSRIAIDAAIRRYEPESDDRDDVDVID